MREHAPLYSPRAESPLPTYSRNFKLHAQLRHFWAAPLNLVGLKSERSQIRACSSRWAHQQQDLHHQTLATLWLKIAALGKKNNYTNIWHISCSHSLRFVIPAQPCLLKDYICMLLICLSSSALLTAYINAASFTFSVSFSSRCMDSFVDISRGWTL